MFQCLRQTWLSTRTKTEFPLSRYRNIYYMKNHSCLHILTVVSLSVLQYQYCSFSTVSTVMSVLCWCVLPVRAARSVLFPVLMRSWTSSMREKQTDMLPSPVSLCVYYSYYCTTSSIITTYSTTIIIVSEVVKKLLLLPVFNPEKLRPHYILIVFNHLQQMLDTFPPFLHILSEIK